MPEADTALARRLRALRRETRNVPEQDIAGRAQVARSAIYQALHMCRQHPPAWATTERIIRALGGDPDDFRGAWQAAQAGEILTAAQQVFLDLEMMREDHREFLASLRTGLVASGGVPGLPAGEYTFGVEQGRVAAWHAVEGCGERFFFSGGGEFLAGVAEHHRQAHADGS